MPMAFGEALPLSSVLSLSHASEAPGELQKRRIAGFPSEFMIHYMWTGPERVHL